MHVPRFGGKKQRGENLLDDRAYRWKRQSRRAAAHPLALTAQSEEAKRIYYEPRCHEGNFGMVGMLVGARSAEKAFQEHRGPDPATIDLYSDSTFFRAPDDDVFLLAE